MLNINIIWYIYIYKYIHIIEIYHILYICVIYYIYVPHILGHAVFSYILIHALARMNYSYTLLLPINQKSAPKARGEE